MKKLSLLVISFMVFSLISCNKLENQTISGSRLIITRIQGLNLESSDSDISFSDIVKLVDDGAGGSYTVTYNDPAKVTILCKLINPSSGEVGTESYYNDVIVDQIDVQYSRSDGLKGEGIYVPYSFSQKVNCAIMVEAYAQIGFNIITHNAKLEKPLIDLIYTKEVLKLEAKITVYGTDLGGHRVAPVTGYLSVWCANFADTTN